MYEKLKLWKYEVIYSADQLKNEFENIYMKFIKTLYNSDNYYFPNIRFYNTIIDRKENIVTAYIDKAVNFSCEINIHLKNIKGTTKTIELEFVYSIPNYGFRKRSKSKNELEMEIIQMMDSSRELNESGQTIFEDKSIGFRIDDRYGQDERWQFFKEMEYKEFEIDKIMKYLSYLQRLGTLIAEEYIDRRYLII